jgi:hypothetical protein
MGKRIEYSKEDKIGNVFYISELPPENDSRKAVFMCFCGKYFSSTIRNIRTGNTKSCGCIKTAILKTKNVAHTKRTTHKSTYSSWQSMHARCYTKSHTSFKEYGGRGILICERWKNNFENFYLDMGDRPTSDHSIDRIDVNKGYSPDNCKWSTRKEQQNNKRNNSFVSFVGKTLTKTEWGDLLTPLVKSRLENGWDIRKAIYKARRGITKRKCTFRISIGG